MKTSDIVKHYARAIANSSPKEWEAFVEAFDAYSTEVTVAVTEAAQHEILQQQGKAQAFLHLLRLFREIKNPPSPSAAS